MYWLLSISIKLPILEFLTDGIINYMVFCDWLLWLRWILKTCYVAACISPFLFIGDSVVWIYQILFIHASVGWYLGYFHFLVVKNMILWTCFGQMFSFLWYIPWMRFLGHIVTVFNHLRNYQTVFQGGCTILHYHGQCMEVPVSLYPFYLCYLCFNYRHPREPRWNAIGF